MSSTVILIVLGVVAVVAQDGGALMGVWSVGLVALTLLAITLAGMAATRATQDREAD